MAWISYEIGIAILIVSLDTGFPLTINSAEKDVSESAEMSVHTGNPVPVSVPALFSGVPALLFSQNCSFFILERVHFVVFCMKCQ